MKPKKCQNCLYAVKAIGRDDSVLVCINKPGSAGKLFLAEPEGLCRNYHTRRIFTPRTDAHQPENDEIRFIPLTKNKVAIVDAADYQWLSKYKWNAAERSTTFYACRNNGTSVYMHRQITKDPKGLVVDHIDGNGLNNRGSNLRLCTVSENLRNRQPTRAGSKYKGVSFRKQRNKWRAEITLNGRHYHIGLFDNETDAAKAYDRKAAELFGEFAYLNFPEFGHRDTRAQEHKA